MNRPVWPVISPSKSVTGLDGPKPTLTTFIGLNGDSRLGLRNRFVESESAGHIFLLNSLGTFYKLVLLGLNH